MAAATNTAVVVLRPGPALNVNREQWLREQRALNWWDALSPEQQIFIHLSLRDSFAPPQGAH